jgi:hypothetical protein
MQARYYSPEMKRFISADPTGLGGGVNFYTYADGNPLNSIDPEGLCARPSLFGRSSAYRYAPDPRYDGRIGYVLRTQGFAVAALLELSDTVGISAVIELGTQRDMVTGQYLTEKETLQRQAQVVFNLATLALGSAKMYGRGFVAGSGAAIEENMAARMARSRSMSAPAASRALTTSRITSPARMLPDPNPAQTYAAKIPTVAAERTIVMGENMKRVGPYAKKIGAEIYEGMPGFKPGMEAEGLLHNQTVIKQKMSEGYKIIDIGPDFPRRAIEGAPKPNYQMERTITKGYKGYQKAFIRTGKDSLFLPEP